MFVPERFLDSQDYVFLNHRSAFSLFRFVQKEEYQLKKQLAALAINVNMEAQKKRTQDVDDRKYVSAVLQIGQCVTLNSFCVQRKQVIFYKVNKTLPNLLQNARSKITELQKSQRRQRPSKKSVREGRTNRQKTGRKGINRYGND